LVFASPGAGCAGCHAGPDFTDGKLVGDPFAHEPQPRRRRDPDQHPGLHGLSLLAPYFHDGRSPDLRDLLTRPDAAMHGSTSSLQPADLDDLLAYLKSL